MRARCPERKFANRQDDLGGWMTEQELQRALGALYADFTNLADLQVPGRPLHLAHYTSLEVLEKVMTNDEVWFSNPLLMNDYQEVRFGLSEATRIVGVPKDDATVLQALNGKENVEKVLGAFSNALQSFDISHLFDVYVFCLSEYDFKDQPDGKLSMWRGYGANGQGAALVFNTSFLTVVQDSPLFFGRVRYGSANERTPWLEELFRRCVDLVNFIPMGTDQSLQFIGAQMFQVALYHSLLSKHTGFAEEQEWRIIYLPDRDTKGLMKDRLGYFRRGHTIEPKLKFPIKPLELEPRQTWTFETILDRIVLGPTHASALAVRSARRMLERLDKPQFANKIWVSEIPYRPI
jgi:hypothetical protein